jgi:hypothetical protein
LIDPTLAPELLSHDRRPGSPPAADASEATEMQRARLIWRFALIAVITLEILVLIALGIYVTAFVILSAMAG